MKKLVGVLSVVLVLALVGAALAEEFATERIPMTILGQPAMMVRTVRQGGPLRGFFGNTAQAQSTYGLSQGGFGSLVCLSTTQSNSDGLGKEMVKNVPAAAMYGGMNIIAAGAIRPDNTSVNVPVKVSNKALNNNINKNNGGSAVSVSGASARADADASAAAAASATATGGNINGNQGGGNND